MDIPMDKLHTVFLYKHITHSHMVYPWRNELICILRLSGKCDGHQCSHMKVISELNEKQTFLKYRKWRDERERKKKNMSLTLSQHEFLWWKLFAGGSYRKSIIHTPCQNITSSINKVTVKAMEHNQEMKSIEDNSSQAKSALCKDMNYAHLISAHTKIN